MKKFEFGKLAVPQNSAKILLLTHTDLDGAGSAILLCSIFSNVIVKHCSNATMSEDIRSAVIDNEDNFDFVYACDISCTKEVADMIDSTPNHVPFVLLDHHTSALALNEFDWAIIEPNMVEDSFRVEYYNGLSGLSSGTALMFDYLDYMGFTPMIENIELCKELVFNISAYDTWDWKKVLKTDRPAELNKLFILYGINLFEEIFIERLSKNGTTLFNDMDNVLFKIENQKIAAYIERKKKVFSEGKISLKDGKTYDIAYCYAAEYIADVFAALQEEKPNKDFYIINTGTGLSFRSVDVTRANVCSIATLYGGGGHPEAAGVSISFDMQDDYIARVLESKIEKPIE